MSTTLINIENMDQEETYVFQIKQWRYEIRKEGFKAWNPGGKEVTPDAKMVEFFYTVYSGIYGQPLLTAEASLAFDAPSGLTYVNAANEPVTITEKISGIVLKEDDGTIVRRFSLSTKDAPPFKVTNDGIIIYVIEDGKVVREEEWFIAGLFIKDKNRTKNYDAFLVRKPRNVVRVMELAELIF